MQFGIVSIAGLIRDHSSLPHSSGAVLEPGKGVLVMKTIT